MESEKQKEDKLATMERQFSGMQSQIMAFADMKEQTHFDNMAKTLYDSHILGKETTTTEAPSPTSKPTSMTTATSAEAAVTDSEKISNSISTATTKTKEAHTKTTHKDSRKSGFLATMRKRRGRSVTPHMD